jgi:Transposase
MEVVMAQQPWAGIDAGKLAHHCVVVDADGKRVFSRRVTNDEATLGELITEVTHLADDGELTWAIDLAGGGAALLITLLLEPAQRLLYIPGRSVHYASAGCRGDAKSDAKDAAIIAHQVRMRRDLQPCGPVMRSPWSSAFLLRDAPIWWLIARGRSTGCGRSCWSISRPWSVRLTTATTSPR